MLSVTRYPLPDGTDTEMPNSLPAKLFGDADAPTSPVSFMVQSAATLSPPSSLTTCIFTMTVAVPGCVGVGVGVWPAVGVGVWLGVGFGVGCGVWPGRRVGV